MVKQTLRVALAFLCASLLAAACHAAERRALLIQVGQYQDRRVPNVIESGGKMIDAAAIKRVLAQKWRFDCSILDGKMASRDRVKEALKELSRDAEPDDVVIVYFSGMGAYSAGHISLCPWDAAYRDTSRDITDLDLTNWLDTVKAHSVTFILDVGLGSKVARPRSDLPRTRRIWCGTGSSLRSKTFRRQTAREDRGPSVLTLGRAIVLRASEPGSEAYEMNVAQDAAGHDQWEGLFTYMLCKHLEQVAPETTSRSLLSTVADDVKKYLRIETGGYTQKPGINGAAELIDRPLFSGTVN